MNKFVCVLVVVCLKNNSVCCLKNTECGYKQCPQTREGALNVHLIPHSHMDAGWVKTYDQYYYGSKPSISTANVQLIYHSVLSELLHDKRRKFTFSEVSYFWRWWKEQQPSTRATFRNLVHEGRVEFAGGGWVQGDEATVDYLMILNQFTWGLRKNLNSTMQDSFECVAPAVSYSAISWKLNDTLGPCGKPKAAWQIDTYGHTREQVSLLAQMGYDGLFIGRVNHKEREAMLEEERMEFMWRGSDVLGKMSDIMTHTLYNLYNAPDGFCFDFLCSEEPLVTDPESRGYNADKRVNDFITLIEHQAKYYEHDNIMVTMGGDFTYQSAANWFMNMDKLINHVNTHPANLSDINIFYSTPSCYLKALYLYGRRDKAIYTETGDHVPYGSDSSTYWTGFYTSRPSLKYLTRRTHAFLQIVKQLTVTARLGDSYELHLLRHALGLMMHHDAITGTSQQHVTNDFVKSLTEAFETCAKKASSLLSYLTPTWGGSRRSKNYQQFSVCHQMNLSQCALPENMESLLLLVYNPQSVKTYHYVRLPAIALHYVIRNSYDEEVEHQLVPLSPAVTGLPGRSSSTNHELVFEAENIPPLGYVAFHITAVKDPLEEINYVKMKKKLGPDMELTPQISNEYLKVTVNKETGLLESIQHVDGMKVMLTQNFHYYSQTRSSLQSGAYSFRPDTGPPVPVAGKVTYNTIRGDLVKEIHQRFSSWVHQTLRLYRGEDFLELDWVIGPIPIDTDLGKEVVSIFATNISSRGEFYTDSNSRQMMKRTCWNDTAGSGAKKPVASCYYPVTSRICILSYNTTTGMCILPDRCQGGTSYRNGEVELMVHRRLLTDDGFGLDETLNEEENGAGLVIRGTHRLLLGNHKREVDELTFPERMSHAAHRWQMEPWLFVAAGDKVNRRKWQNLRNKRFSALRVHGLPRHIRVLTLEPWKANSVLLRLENTLEKSDRTAQKRNIPDEQPLPSHINVELQKIFQHLHIVSVRETTLGANQWLEDARQMDWSTRYVYAGGDDGLLPEDIDYVEEDKFKHKDSEHSEEESEFLNRRNERRLRIEPIKHNKKTRYEDRRKRSVNISDNFIDNICSSLNKALKDESTIENNDFEKEEPITEQTDFKNDGIKEDPAVTATDFDKNEIMEESTTEQINFENEDIKIKTTTEQMEDQDGEASNLLEKDFTFDGVSVLITEKPNINFDPPKRNEDISVLKTLGSSGEEETSKVRSSRDNGKRKRVGVDFDTNQEEEEITRSIFEMYYKKKTMVRPLGALIRNFAKVTEPPRRKKNTEKNMKEDRSTHMRNIKRTRKTGTFQFRPKGSRAYESGEETHTSAEEEEEEINMELARMRARRSGERGGDADNRRGGNTMRKRSGDAAKRRMRGGDASRRKRATSKDALAPVEEAEPEYIVTLRPTQIRTFIVRFDSSRRN